MTNPILEKFYQEIVGQGDFELSPKPLARKFRDDDQRVLETGEEMPQIVELFLSRQGLPDCFLTTKMPIRDLTGKPAGIMGPVQRFKEDTGLTPKQFLGRSRVQLGCQMPQQTAASIAEIAIDFGYCDQNAFAAQFRQRMGFTSNRYRKTFDLKKPDHSVCQDEKYASIPEVE